MDQQPQDQVASTNNPPVYPRDVGEEKIISESNTGTGSTDGGPAGAVTPKPTMKPLDVNFFSPTPPKVVVRKEAVARTSSLHNSTILAEVDAVKEQSTPSSTGDVQNTPSEKVDLPKAESLTNPDSAEKSQIKELNTRPKQLSPSPTNNNNVHVKKLDSPVSNTISGEVASVEAVTDLGLEAASVDNTKGATPSASRQLKKSDKNITASSVFDTVNSIIEEAKQLDASGSAKGIDTAASPVTADSKTFQNSTKPSFHFDVSGKIDSSSEASNFFDNSRNITTSSASEDNRLDKIAKHEPKVEASTNNGAQIHSSGAISSTKPNPKEESALADSVTDFFESVNAAQTSVDNPGEIHAEGYGDRSMPGYTVPESQTQESLQSQMYSHGPNNNVVTNNIHNQNNANSQSDWVECFDQNSGYPYWYNSKTGESSWHKPQASHQQYTKDNGYANEPMHSQQYNSAEAYGNQNATHTTNANVSRSRNAHLYMQKQQQQAQLQREMQQQRSLVKPKKMKDRRKSHLAHLARVSSNNHYGASSPAVNSPAVFSPTVYGNTSTPQESGAIAYNAEQNKHPLLQAFGSKPKRREAKKKRRERRNPKQLKYGQSGQAQSTAEQQNHSSFAATSGATANYQGINEYGHTAPSPYSVAGSNISLQTQQVYHSQPYTAAIQEPQVSVTPSELQSGLDTPSELSGSANSGVPANQDRASLYVETNLPNNPQNNEMTPQPEGATKPLEQDNGNTEVTENCQQKSDPQHADTPSLQAIRQATASIFADLNSNLESIKQFESGSTPQKNEEMNAFAQNSTQDDASTSHVPPTAPTLLREDTPVSAKEKTAAIPGNIMLKTSPVYADKEIPANMPQQERQQQKTQQQETQQQQGEILAKEQVTQQTAPKKTKRRGTNAHLLLKKASIQAAMPKQPEVKKKKPKKKTRNHLAHLAKVEAVFTDETVDSNSPSSVNSKTPSVGNGTTAPGQPLQGPPNVQQGYDAQNYYNQNAGQYYNNNGTNNQTAYYAQQQQYYQGDSQHNAHIQNTPYAQQQQPYGGATFNLQQKNMQGSSDSVANTTNLADTSLANQQINQIIPGKPSDAELKEAEERRKEAEKKKLEKQKRAAERKKKAAEWKKKQAEKRKVQNANNAANTVGAEQSTPPLPIATDNAPYTSAIGSSSFTQTNGPPTSGAPPSGPPTSGAPPSGPLTSGPPMSESHAAAGSNAKRTEYRASRNSHLSKSSIVTETTSLGIEDVEKYKHHPFDPRSRGPVFSFGFGGRIVTTKAQFRNGKTTYRKVGSVKVSKLNEIFFSNKAICKVSDFPGPLYTDTQDQFQNRSTLSKLKVFLEQRVVSAEAESESREAKVLWSILLHLISFSDIRKATVANQQYSSEVINMLTKYCAEVKAERAINEANMSILTKVTEEETKHIELKHTNDENNTSVTSTKDADVDEGDKSANATADSLKHNEDDESAVSKVDEKKTGGDSEGNQGEDEKVTSVVEEKNENINMDVKDAMGTNVHCELQLAKLVRDKQLVDAVIFAKAKRMWAHALILSQIVSASDYMNTVKEFTATFSDNISHLKVLYSSSSKAFCSSKSIFLGWAQRAIDILQNDCDAASKRSGLNKLGNRLLDSSHAVENDVECDSYCVAAHICYILGQRKMDVAREPGARMLLLGANHLRWPYGYATIDSLQRTEILEYIRKLQSTTGNTDFVSYQSFKILYATKLCDYGHIDRARKYIDALKYSVLNESSRAELEVLEDALVGGKPVTFEAQYSNVTTTNDQSSYHQHQSQAMLPQQYSTHQHQPQVMMPQQHSTQHNHVETQEQQQVQLQQQQNNLQETQQPEPLQQFQPQQFQQQAQQILQKQQEQQQAASSVPEGQNEGKSGGGWFSSMLVHAIHGGSEESEGASTVNNDKQPTQNVQHQPPPQQPKKETEVPKATEKPKEPEQTDPAKTEGNSSGGGGITGWLRGAFMKKEDQDKVAKQGKGLEAYYDKDLKRWVFPDDPSSAQPVQELAPPPTFGDTNTVSKSNSDQAGTSAPSSQDPHNAEADPMSALMAPPSYRLNQRKNVSSRYASVGFAISEDTNDKSSYNSNYGPPAIGNGAPPKIMSFNNA